ncbi:MAG: rhodanese-like domain-containing protein [Candidatus Woesearchaeota archaeon]
MNIKPNQVKKKHHLIIDVRTPKEYKEKHIPGSFNIPLNDIPKYKKELSQIKKNVAFLCRSGARATQACQILKDNKLDSNVIEGGIQNWEKEGLKVVYGPKSWELERQVRLAAGGLVTTGVILGALVNPWFYALSGFVGLGLMYAGITNTCGMAFMLTKAPWNKVKHNTKHVVNKLGETQ